MPRRVTISKSASWNLLTRPFKARPPQHVMKTVGCLECRDTGYLGRVGVYEIMLMTEALREMIKGDSDMDTLRRQGVKDGMRTLRLSGAQKVGAGLTTIAEVLRVTPSTLS